MSRQGLRSTKNDDRNMTEEPGQNNPEEEDLDITLTEISKDRGSTNMPRPGGPEMEAGNSNQGTTELITRKLEDLEKRVKRMIEEEKNVERS